MRLVQLGEVSRFYSVSYSKIGSCYESAGAPAYFRPARRHDSKNQKKLKVCLSIGSTTGTLQQEQLTAEKKRQAELTNAERELRGIYTINMAFIDALKNYAKGLGAVYH